jgi:hypothetical protein
MKFNKVLAARNNPRNKCYAADGEWLIIARDEHKMKGRLPADHHFFIGVSSHQPSRYGWVSAVDSEISAHEYAAKYDQDPDPELVESCQLLLTALKSQKIDTPMACTFSTVGVMQKQRKLKVHKVFFYKA